MLRIAVVILVAYLVTGIHYVWRDVRANIVHQPAYARDYTQRGHISPLILAVLVWLPFTVASCFLPGTRLGMLTREAVSWLLFVVLICGGLYVTL